MAMMEQPGVVPAEGVGTQEAALWGRLLCVVLM